MSEKKKLLIVGSAFLLGFMIIGGIMLLGYGKNFDAGGYVQSALDHTLKGNVEGATDIVTDATEKEMYESYEKTVQNFVDTNILSGVDVDEKLYEKYIEAGKTVLGTTKYQVISSKRIKRQEYVVSVAYESSNIFPVFVQKVEKYSKKLLKEAETKYETTDAKKIEQEMSKEFLQGAYKILCKAAEEVSYNEKQTFEFTVKADENAVFEIGEEQISEFIAKILCLDEIQD